MHYPKIFKETRTLQIGKDSILDSQFYTNDFSRISEINIKFWSPERLLVLFNRCNFCPMIILLEDCILQTNTLKSILNRVGSLVLFFKLQTCKFIGKNDAVQTLFDIYKRMKEVVIFQIRGSDLSHENLIELTSLIVSSDRHKAALMEDIVVCFTASNLKKTFLTDLHQALKGHSINISTASAPLELRLFHCDLTLDDSLDFKKWNIRILC